MKFLEYDLEEIIQMSDRKKLKERGLYVQGKMYRQLRIGNYGVADLVTFTRPKYIFDGIIEPGCITIYELKKDSISVSAFIQAIGYARGIQRYLMEKSFLLSDNMSIKIVLIGRTIDINSTFVFLPEIINNSNCEYSFQLEMLKYSYNVEGLLFSEISGYKLNNEGFKFNNLPF